MDITEDSGKLSTRAHVCVCACTSPRPPQPLEVCFFKKPENTNGDPKWQSAELGDCEI